MENDRQNEEMLRAWLRLSTDIPNTRIVKNMSYNEALICNILSGEEENSLTATDLCERTHMLKSQMNRTLNAMEEKGLIARARSRTGRRQNYIRLSAETRLLFEEEHKKNLALVGEVLDHYGRERAEELIENLNDILAIVEEVFA